MEPSQSVRADLTCLNGPSFPGLNLGTVAACEQLRARNPRIFAEEAYVARPGRGGGLCVQLHMYLFMLAEQISLTILRSLIKSHCR